MDVIIDTGFYDKTGKPIHVGDVVQYRLGKFGKSGGSILKRVEKCGKRFCLVDESLSASQHTGVKINDATCQYLVVIDCRHM